MNGWHADCRREADTLEPATATVDGSFHRQFWPGPVCPFQVRGTPYSDRFVDIVRGFAQKSISRQWCTNHKHAVFCLFVVVFFHKSDTCMLVIQQYKLKTHGFCTFSCFGPHIWNSLPQDLRHCSTLSFKKKKKLKTFLYSQYFHPN